MPNIYLTSLGCDKNRVDGETMIGTLRQAGYQVVNDPDIAHCIIVNTCGFIKDAVEESINLILELSDHKTNGICKTLIAVGCMAQRYKEEIQNAIPEVDLIIGVGKYASIAGLLEDSIGKPDGKPQQGAVETAHPRLAARSDDITPHIAYVKISEGCDNHCTYCTIPSIRGPYTSRPMEDIYEETHALVTHGAREIVLVAQDTSLYGTDIYGEKRLPALLKKLAAIPSLTWIRIMYLYPEHITQELIDTIADTPNIVKYVDMPLQHAETTVLKRMNRAGTTDALHATIKALQAKGIAIRTTFIVGFPGETEAEFEGLCQFVQAVGFDRMGVFPYSQEDGTPAAKMPDQIDQDTKIERLAELMAIQQAIHFAKQEAKVGKAVAVMADTENIARTQHDAYEVDAVVEIADSPALVPGQLYQAHITNMYEYDLLGRIIEDETRGDYEPTK